jgi:NAD-dependent deacetylase
MPITAAIHRLKEALQKAERVAVLTGAGVSAESGVHPAASLAVTAKSGGALVAEINLEKTPSSGLMDMVFLGRAGEILPQLVEGLS